MLAEASGKGWEGVIATRVDARHRPGRRSDPRQKLKVQHRAEFVVGGYTEPRRTREALGALLLGYFDAETRHSPSPSRPMSQHTGSVQGS